MKATESVGQTQTVRGTATGTLGLPAVMGASAVIDTTTADDTKDIAEHTFDPLWANSRRLLNYLTQHELIHDNVWEAHLGTFVEMEGTLSIVDLGILLPIFQDAALKKNFVDTVLKNDGVNPNSPQGRDIKTTFDLIFKLPQAIHLYIYGDSANACATVTSESLVTAAHDIAFKHGAGIRGSWTVLGILDAWPDNRQNPTDEEPNPKTLDEAAANLLPDGVAKVAANFTNLARNTVGRPRDYFGITPLLIYRKVSG